MEYRLNSAIAVEAIKKARSGVIFVFPEKPAEKSKDTINLIKSYTSIFIISGTECLLRETHALLLHRDPISKLGIPDIMDHLLSDLA